MRLAEKKKIFNKTFVKIIFEKLFCIFYFLRFSVKEKGFPSLEGDFFVTFIHMELTRFLLGCENYLISVFDSARLSKTFIWKVGETRSFANLGKLSDAGLLYYCT